MIEVLKQALEALELEDLACRYEKEQTPEHIAKAIASLQQAIADAEKHEVSQEPVAWVDDERGVVDFNSYVPEPGTPLYTHPPKREWVETTEKDVHECFMLTEFDYHVDFNRDPEQWCLAFAKELSDTLKQKNGYAEENKHD